MKIVICDCCGKDFSYNEITARTDGDYKTVKIGKLNVRVCLSVKATLAVDGEHADICPTCRVNAIEELLGEPVSGH